MEDDLRLPVPDCAHHEEISTRDRDEQSADQTKRQRSRFFRRWHLLHYRIRPTARVGSRAVNISRSRSIGIAKVLGVRPDRFDHQIEPTVAVDLACYATH